ncbi:hypothetical protein M3J07_000485 [Ascochyta lentis]
MANVKSLRSLFKTIALLAAIFLLIFGFGFVRYSDRVLRTQPISTESLNPSSEEKSGGVHIADFPATAPTGPLRKANDTLLAQTPAYIHAVLNQSDSTFARLECPQPDLDRYIYLGHPPDQTEGSQLPRFFFALDLHQCVHLLPRLLGSILETIRFLGPENCVLSIVEGRSNDGTFEVLYELRLSLQALGVKYFLQTSDVNPTSPGKGRIGSLAGLRNLAL